MQEIYFYIFASCEGLIASFMLNPNMAMKIELRKMFKKFDDFDLSFLHVLRF